MNKPMPDSGIIDKLLAIPDNGATLLAYLNSFAANGGTVHNYMPSCGVTTVYSGCTIIDGSKGKKNTTATTGSGGTNTSKNNNKPGNPSPPSPPTPKVPTVDPNEEEVLSEDVNGTGDDYVDEVTPTEFNVDNNDIDIIPTVMY